MACQFLLAFMTSLEFPGGRAGPSPTDTESLRIGAVRHRVTVHGHILSAEFECYPFRKRARGQISLCRVRSGDVQQGESHAEDTGDKGGCEIKTQKQITASSCVPNGQREFRGSIMAETSIDETHYWKSRAEPTSIPDYQVGFFGFGPHSIERAWKRYSRILQKTIVHKSIEYKQ
jgi:hypothetical protein